MANSGRGLLNREKRTKEKAWQHPPPQYSRAWINRVRLPILLTSWRTGQKNIPLSPFALEDLVSR